MWISDYQRWLSEEESMKNAQLIANHFTNSDWSKESIAALCGNMRHESSVNPDMYEYGFDWSEDRGYGLVQWTPRSKYWNWAIERNLPPRNGDSQLARLDYEVENNIQYIPNGHKVRYNRESKYDFSFSDFRGNTQGLTVNQLTEAFMWNYEGPNYQKGISSLSDRQKFAQRVYNEVDFDGIGGGSKPAFPTTEGLPITSTYGWRPPPTEGASEYHWAIDIGGNGVNHPIYATQDGIVTQNTWNDVSGWRLRIKHTGDPYHSQYQHLHVQSPLSVGTNVRKGDRIGTMGTTGVSSGIHLDFAISINGTFYTEEDTIDPEIYLEMTFGGGGEPPQQTKDLILLLLVDALSGWKW